MALDHAIKGDHQTPAEIWAGLQFELNKLYDDGKGPGTELSKRIVEAEKNLVHWAWGQYINGDVDKVAYTRVKRLFDAYWAGKLDTNAKLILLLLCHDCPIVD